MSPAHQNSSRNFSRHSSDPRASSNSPTRASLRTLALIAAILDSSLLNEANVLTGRPGAGLAEARVSEIEVTKLPCIAGIGVAAASSVVPLDQSGEQLASLGRRVSFRRGATKLLGGL